MKYYDKDGNEVAVVSVTGTELTHDSSILPTVDSTLQFIGTSVYYGSSVEGTIKAQNAILEALSKNVMFEITYPDGTKTIKNYDQTMDELLHANISIPNSKLIIVPLYNKAAKTLYGKNED